MVFDARRRCPTTRAVPVISFHGSADPVDPFAGHGQKYWTYSVTTAAKDWSSQDHCTSTPRSTAGERRQVDDVLAVVQTTRKSSSTRSSAKDTSGPVDHVAAGAHRGPWAAVDARQLPNALMWAFFQARPTDPWRSDQPTVMPPSTATSAPVIAEAAGEHSHVIADATSIGSISRPMGCCWANSSALERS